MTHANQIQKIKLVMQANKFLILVHLLKKPIIMLKLLNQKKIPSIGGLAINSELNAIGNKIPDVSSLVKKTDQDTKIYEMENEVTCHDHDKYITTPDLNKITAEIFAPRLEQVNLVTKTDFEETNRL